MKQKRILILMTKLYMGGFSKSMLNFMFCMQRNKNVKVDVLFLENESTELEKDIPEEVRIIRINELQYRTWDISNIKVTYYHLKYLFYEFYYKAFRHDGVPGDRVREYSQAKLVNKAKRMMNDFSFTRDYDAVISWEEGLCNYVLVDKIPARYKVGFIHPNYLEAKFAKNIDSPYIKKMDRIITISNSCYETLKTVFPWAQEKIFYVPNRLNYQNLLKKSEEYKADVDLTVPSFLTVARVVDEDKAVFRIAELCKKLKENGFKFKWYLVGDGYDLPMLRELINKLNIVDCLICTGELSNPCPYMKQSNVFIMQSHREGRPVAVDEALLLGTPALITAYSSASEQILNDETGWIVEDDFNAIYEKISFLLENPESIKRTAENVAQIDKNLYEDCSQLLDVALNKENKT